MADELSPELRQLILDRLAESKAALEKGGFDPYHPRQPLDWQQQGLDEAAALAGVTPEVAASMLRAVAQVRIQESVFMTRYRSASETLELARGLLDETASLSGDAIAGYEDFKDTSGVSMLNFVELLSLLIARAEPPIPLGSGTPSSARWADASKAHLLDAARLALMRGNALSQSDGPFEDTEDAFERATVLGERVGTPEGLAVAADAQRWLAFDLFAAHGQIEQIELACGHATSLGERAGTPEGLGAAADAQHWLGLSLRQADRPFEEIERAYIRATVLGEQAGSPEGMLIVARAWGLLGTELVSAGRSFEEIEGAFGRSTVLGERVGTPEGLTVAADSQAGLVLGLLAAERPFVEIEAACVRATSLGEQAGIPEGLAAAADAQNYLGIALSLDAGRPIEEIERSWQRAIALAEQSGTQKGLATAERVRSNWEPLLAAARTIRRESITG